jgi:hypothetical protein
VQLHIVVRIRIQELNPRNWQALALSTELRGQTYSLVFEDSTG